MDAAPMLERRGRAIVAEKLRVQCLKHCHGRDPRSKRVGPHGASRRDRIFRSYEARQERGTTSDHAEQSTNTHIKIRQGAIGLRCALTDADNISAPKAGLQHRVLRVEEAPLPMDGRRMIRMQRVP